MTPCLNPKILWEWLSSWCMLRSCQFYYSISSSSSLTTLFWSGSCLLQHSLWNMIRPWFLLQPGLHSGLSVLCGGIWFWSITTREIKRYPGTWWRIHVILHGLGVRHNSCFLMAPVQTAHLQAEKFSRNPFNNCQLTSVNTLTLIYSHPLHEKGSPSINMHF